MGFVTNAVAAGLRRSGEMPPERGGISPETGRATMPSWFALFARILPIGDIR